MITVDIVLYYNDSYSLLQVRFGLCKYIFIFGLYTYPDMQSRSPLLSAPKGWLTNEDLMMWYGFVWKCRVPLHWILIILPILIAIWEYTPFFRHTHIV